MAKPQSVEVPGATEAAATAAPAETQAALIERLLAENAALRAAVPATDTPSIVFTPETPHGKAAMAASPFGHMSADEVLKGMLDGSIPQPVTSYLTRDGYVCRTTAAR